MKNESAEQSKSFSKRGTEMFVQVNFKGEFNQSKQAENRTQIIQSW